MGDRGRRFNLGHERSAGSVWPETAAVTTEIHKQRSKTRVQKSEQRSQEEDGGSKGQVDWGAVQEHREGNDVRNSKEAYNTLKALTKTQQHKPAVIQDSSGNILMESIAVLNHWTEYCSGLYNYELHSDASLPQSNQTLTQEAESLPMLREEVEKAVHSLKAGKSPGVTNIPS